MGDTEYSETTPVQYQAGRVSFLDMAIKVDPRVLIPRPETELLVTKVIELCSARSLTEPSILDIGTGSGIIPLGISREMEKCKILAVDISQDAIDLAQENVKEQGMDNIRFMVSDMFSAFDREQEGTFDVIVSNPPYVSGKDYEKVDAWVKAEPKIALYAGEEGMDCLNIIAEESYRFLANGGFVAVEIGYDQAEKVKKKFSLAGFTEITGFKDFNGFERVIVGWKNG